jgi:maltose alpha-D-glucosyltransferase/alpha-amylase
VRLEFRPTSRFSDRPTKQPEHIRAVETEQSNSMALVDEDYVVKIYRKLENGINPEIEMGRFLTEVAGFANSPALLGTVELIEGERRSAIGAVHAFVPNQGDAWTVTSAYLDRFVDEQRLLAVGDEPKDSEDQISYLHYMSQTGKRVAEMHLALASNKDLADFAPEPTKPEDVQRWIDDVMARAERVFDTLAQRRETLKEADRPLADRAHALLPDDLTIETNRAHALMFAGRGEDSETLYLAHKGKPVSAQDARLWEHVIAEDFAEFRKAGLTHPMMAGIEKELGPLMAIE